MTIEQELAELRREVVLQALYDCYPDERGILLILGGIDRPDLNLNHETVRQALQYETDRRHIASRQTGQGILMARLLPDGVDVVEALPAFNPLQRDRLRMLRLRLLSAMNALPTDWLSERLIRAYLREDLDLDLTHPNIPRAQSYLAQRGMIEMDSARQLARILPDGIDYLNGAGQTLVGIARPVQF